MPAEIRGRAPGGGPRTSQRPPSRLAGKRKANELANSGDSMEPAIKRPAPDAASVPLPAKSSATGEQGANGSLKLGPPEGGSTYAAVLAGFAAPNQPSGTLKPTAMDSDPSEPAVSTETAIRRMSQDMSGPLSGTPAGTTFNAKVANTCAPAGERPNKTPIFISCVSDTRAFLAWLPSSCPSGLAAQQKGEKLMVVPSTADGSRAAVSSL